jgi:hypothetical protein
MKETNQKKGIEKQKNNKKEERISYKKWAGGGEKKERKEKKPLYIYIYIYISRPHIVVLLPPINLSPPQIAMLKC